MLSSLHLSTAVVFLTIAIPLKAHGRWLTIGWLVEGAALLWASTRTRSLLLRVLSMLCLALGLLALLTVNPRRLHDSTSSMSALERTASPSLSSLSYSGWHAKPRRKTALRIRGPRGQVFVRGVGIRHPGPCSPQRPSSSSTVSSSSPSAGRSTASGGLFSGTATTGFCTATRCMRSSPTRRSSWLLARRFSPLGFWRRSAFLRWQALVLLAISIGKVFLLDISSLSEGYRILSFLGLGALLLAVSFVYQRDWLNLRSHGGPTP